MKFLNKIGKICKKVYDKISDKEFAEVFKMRKEDYSRNRKVGFVGTMLIVLNKTGRGVASAIRVYREAVKLETESYSKQAFSKGRMRIKWEAFREIFRMTALEFYKEFKYETYKGFRVSAIDGTKINLPYNEDSKKEFGIQESSGGVIQSLGSCLYDVLNGIIIDATASSCSSNERELAKQHLNYLSEIKTNKELIIFDRGYPSAELIDFIDKKGFKYLMRADETFARGFLKKTSGNDCVLTHTFVKSKMEVKLRVIQIPIKDSNGNETTELLITNLFDKKFNCDDFKELYHLRWGIESKYHDIKNKLQIENFTGTGPLAVRQDFYATMFLSNIASIMIFENADEIKRLHNSEKNKYEYKANINNVISLLKESVVQMLIVDSKFKRRKLMKKIYADITNSVIPIRNGRSFPRDKKHKSAKFAQNQKS